CALAAPARRRHAVTAAPAITTPRRIPVARSSDSQPISTTPLVVEAARRRPERSAGRSNGDDSSLGRLGKRKARSRLGGASGGNSRGGRVAVAPVLDPDGVAGALRERERLERKAAGGVGAVGPPGATACTNRPRGVPADAAAGGGMASPTWRC